MSAAQKIVALVAVLILAIPAVGLWSSSQPPAQASQPAQASAKSYQFEDGKMLVIQVPVMALTKATEFQTCFVWQSGRSQRDSLSCPNDRSTYSVDPP